MLKRILVTTGIVLGVIVVAAAFFAGWFFWQLKDMQTVKSGRITEKIIAISGKMSNMYLVQVGEQTYIAFDAGDDPVIIKSEMAKMQIDPAMVAAVFLTHSDDDHVGALSVFPKADVYLSNNEIPLIDGRGKRKFLFMKGNNSLCTKTYTGLPAKDCVCIEGATVQAFETPGHTPGSMSFLIDSALFTGDLCILKDGMIKPMLQVFTEDMQRDGQSIKDVAKIGGIGAIYTAHTGHTTDIKKAFADWH